MKKAILIATICFFIFTGCSSESGNKNGNNDISKENSKSPKKMTKIENISNEKVREDIQKRIEVFYYNPLVTKKTDYEFFENNEKMIEFASYYKNEYNIEKSPSDIIKNLFGKEIDQIQIENKENNLGYHNSSEKQYVPIVEGIYKNDDIVIAKTGLYTLAEETNSEKKSVGVITGTFEKNEDGSYYMIDYIYEKHETEEQ